LRAIYHQALAKERSAAWNLAADKVRAVRDQLAAELKERYPAICTELVGLFRRIAECDAKVSEINMSGGYEQRRQTFKLDRYKSSLVITTQ
jgi:hypothetical protein